jgi:DNA-binding transcriptional ArsR family regulator
VPPNLAEGSAWYRLDAVFKALADPTRRSLLDELFKRGRADAERARAALPMTRFGVMKHLRVLEEAGLVSPSGAGARSSTS